MSDFKKVLVACPTAAAKNYCFKEWIDNIMNFTYPNFDIRLFDNTDDNGANANYLNEYVKTEYVNIGNKFFAENTLVKHNIKSTSIIAKMCVSHNDCRTYALDNEYDYLLHLESDIFPPLDVIERLMFRQKNIVAGLYWIGEGLYRKAMVTESIKLSDYCYSAHYLTPDIGEIRLLNGELQLASQVGLGCVLISKKALERVPFRYEVDGKCHPDTYWSQDCAEMKIPIHLDSSVVCRHENRMWGFYGLDFT